ncbi:MAG: hypothetical protein H7210_08090 [Pyrinomonadaceae bacterium]|nr:hypothetical protein [Phycisphaerales bacterium]
MNKLSVVLGLCAPLAVSTMVQAQPATEPVIWTWNAPLGNALTDARFRPMVHYDLNWGFTPNYPGTPALLVARDGESVASAVADEVLRREEKYPVLLLRSIGRKNLVDPYEPGLYGQFTPLYDYHETTTDTDRVNIGSQWVPFIWMTKGIAAQTIWTDEFLATYEEVVGHDPVFAPERIAFDQEPPSTMLGLSWADLQALWTAVTGNSRWDTTAVPGYGTQNLKDLWVAASMPAPGPQGSNSLYMGGSEPNHRWWTWLFEVEQTAIASALDKAFYSRVASRGGIWTGVTCCDYEGTMRSDGLADDYPGVAANANCTSTYRGTLGPFGVRYAQRCSGSNIVQAPHLYTDSSFYSWKKFSLGGQAGIDRWASTDDQHTPDYGRDGPRDLNGIPTLNEFWQETSKRQWRFKLDACAKSFDGTNAPIDAWVTLPNQPLFMLGMGNTTYPGMYDGQTYARNEMAGRQSFRATLDSLAIAKNHRVKRLLLWNDHGLYQKGPHSHFAKNWDYFQRAVDLVWGINLTEFRVDPAGNTLPQGYSQATRIDKVAYADGSVTTDATNRVQVTTNSGSGIWSVSHFQMKSDLAQVGSRPKSLNFNVDVVLNQSVRLYPFIWDWHNGQWINIGNSSGVPDIDGRAYPVYSTAGKTTRLTTSIAYSDTYRSTTGAPNTIMFALFATPEVGGVMTGYFDMVQCYGGDEGDESRWRPLGDMNGDYDVTNADAAKADELFTGYFNYLSWEETNPGQTNPYAAFPAFVAWLDFDRDGDVDSDDQTIWSDHFKDEARKIDDFKRSSVDYR